VRENAVGDARHGVHADEQRRVATGLEEGRVLRPLLLHDVLAVGVEEVGNERVEAIVAARAVVVHDDDLGRAGRLRAPHGGIDLLGVEDATLLVELRVTAGLRALDDAGDALHVTDHVDAHGRDDNVTQMDTGLAGKGVLVTGGAGGIGSACVRAFAAEGARVAIHYRTNGDRAAELAGKTGGVALGANLTVETEVEQLFADAEGALGSLEVCVAVAGFWPREDEPVWQLPLERWEATLRTNLTATFLTARGFLRIVERTGHGNLVLVGSTAGRFGEAGHADYAAAKAAIQRGLLLSLKNEIVRIAPRGRVNAVAPGWNLLADDARRARPRARGPAQPHDGPAARSRRRRTSHARSSSSRTDELSGHVTGEGRHRCRWDGGSHRARARMSRFLERLASGRPIVADGGMGALIASAAPGLRCPEEANLRSPETVLEVHLGFIRAGAELIETNTFGANRAKLGRQFLTEDLEAVNAAAVRIAREAREVAGQDVFIGGSIGPLGDVELQGVDPGELFAEQARVLEGRGVDLFMVETFFDLGELETALAAAQEDKSRVIAEAADLLYHLLVLLQARGVTLPRSRRRWKSARRRPGTRKRPRANSSARNRLWNSAPKRSSRLTARFRASNGRRCVTTRR